MSFNLNIPDIAGVLFPISIEAGDKLFIMGANGTGKSSLMQWVYKSYSANAQWISAHRQTWFISNAIDFSPQQRRDYENGMRSQDLNIDARWKDQYANQRTSIALYDLIDADNIRNRAITAAVDNNDMEGAKNLSKINSAIKIINELLYLSNIPIELFIVERDQLFARKRGGTPYSVAELSDGERNALLIAANVLTVNPFSLVLIDEPERHLHRSIISPFLTHLLSKREDCAFMVSTHDTILPFDNPSARTLLIRGCTYAGSSVSGWEIDILDPKTQIDDVIKKDILGARKKILFVEGNDKSLDKPLYSLIFPNVSVISKSNCRDVEDTVSSIRGSDHLHWVHALGIVDNDRRPQSDLNKLKEKGIYALPVISVESIYYHPHIQQLIAQRQADFFGGEVSTYVNNAKAAAIKEIEPHIQRLSRRTAEKAIREEFFRNIPKEAGIKDETDITVFIEVSKFVKEEYERLRSALNAGNLGEIISRYPVRETNALKKITEVFKFQKREHYEEAVRKLLMDNVDALNVVKSLFGTLISDIEGEYKSNF
ncbi:MAG: AAA family ATPase [Cyanobacteriota bacterium]|nr:AAA family ATPase [Cyanobacteriota bacterium]